MTTPHEQHPGSVRALEALETLKPCPFCGGEGAVIESGADDDDPIFNVGCRACHLWFEGYYHTEVAAITAWNRRAEVRTAPAQESSPNRAGCYDCWRPYGDEHGFPDLLVPTWAWRLISPTGHEGGLLCPCCIAQRLHAAGLRDVPAMWASGPLTAVMYVDGEAGRAWLAQDRSQCVVNAAPSQAGEPGGVPIGEPVATIHVSSTWCHLHGWITGPCHCLGGRLPHSAEPENG